MQEQVFNQARHWIDTTPSLRQQKWLHKITVMKQ